jgi:hypothetical protein
MKANLTFYLMSQSNQDVYHLMSMYQGNTNSYTHNLHCLSLICYDGSQCKDLIVLNHSRWKCFCANASDLSNDCGLQERNAMLILA